MEKKWFFVFFGLSMMPVRLGLLAGGLGWSNRAAVQDWRSEKLALHCLWLLLHSPEEESTGRNLCSWEVGQHPQIITDR